MEFVEEVSKMKPKTGDGSAAAAACGICGNGGINGGTDVSLVGAMLSHNLAKVLLVICVIFSVGASAALVAPQPQNIFLMAGQSNMVGHGGLFTGADGQTHWDGCVPAQCRSNPAIFKFTMAREWVVAEEPIHGGIFQGHQNVTGIGPGMPFANQILDLIPTYGTIGLVPCAFDDSGLDQWVRGNGLYRNLTARAKAAVAGGGRIAALLWWQGGRDAKNETLAREYKYKLEDFFNSLREDLAMPDLLILMIVMQPGRAKYTDIVRVGQLSMILPNLIRLDAPDVPIGPDGIHVTTPGQVSIGGQLAYALPLPGNC